jgi:hypothetical protein
MRVLLPCDTKGNDMKKEKAPYLVINTVEGFYVGSSLRKTLKAAINCAVKIAAEQCDTPEEEIRHDLEKDLRFSTATGDIDVQIDQPNMR